MLGGITFRRTSQIKVSQLGTNGYAQFLTLSFWCHPSSRRSVALRCVALRYVSSLCCVALFLPSILPSFLPPRPIRSPGFAPAFRVRLGPSQGSARPPFASPRRPLQPSPLGWRPPALFYGDLRLCSRIASRFATRTASRAIRDASIRFLSPWPYPLSVSVHSPCIL